MLKLTDYLESATIAIMGSHLAIAFKQHHWVQNLRKVMLWLSITVIFSYIGCSPGVKTAKPPVLLTILVGFGTGGDHYQVEFHQQLAREFNESHPDVNIRFETVNYAEHDQAFAAMLVDGTAPDLVLPIGVPGIATYYNDWLDLAPLLQTETGLKDDFYPRVLAANQYEKHLFGLPLGFYPSVLYYNADMFDRIKLGYPPHTFNAKGWNYDALVKLAVRLTRDKNGKLPTNQGFDPELIVQFGYDGLDWSPLRAVTAKFGPGGNGLSRELKSARMNSAEWKNALRFVHDSIFTQYVRARSNGSSTESIFGDNDPLGSNRTAMWESFSWVQYAYNAWNNNFSWDVAAIPAMGNNAPVSACNTESIAIPKLAKNPQLSWKVAKWLLKAENLSRLCQSYGCIPVRKSLASVWLEGQKKINPTVDWQVFLDATNWLDSPNHEAWLPNYKKVQDALESTLNGIVSGADGDTDQVAERLNRCVQGFLDEYWQLKQ